MLIRGDRLTDGQRQQVLAAFVYRWTVENGQRGAAYRGLETPTMPLQSDAAWLREHAFYFTKDGSRLMRNRNHAEPAFLAEEGGK